MKHDTPDFSLRRIGYFSESSNWLECAGRMFWLKIVIAAGLFSSLLLSPKLWISARYYPSAPVWDWLSAIPAPYDYAIFAALLASVIGILLSARPRLFIIAFVILAVVLCIFDQSRLQPWFYQYFFMLLVLGLFSWSRDDEKGCDAALNTCRVIVAGIYFYSGLQKVNPTFFTEVFPWVADPIIQLMPENLKAIPALIGRAVPFLEMMIGIGLVIPRLRSLALLIALAMLLFLLTVLGPLGRNWNSVVWPWNVAIFLMAFILCWKSQHVGATAILWARRYFPHRVALLLFGLLPLSSFFDVWDAYPSFSLYSGTTSKVQIVYLEEVHQKLPQVVRQYATEAKPGIYALNVSGWSFDEMNVPPYPERRVYQHVLRYLCGYEQKEKSVAMIVTDRWTWSRAAKSTVYHCKDLTRQ